VLEIEVMDSYIKRMMGPMVTIEVLNIARVPRYVKIPSINPYD
jgi:hypothetical protein